jgi:hypothetical protein
MMKLMKSILIITFLTSVVICVQAQNKIGIRGGYQSSTFNINGSQLPNTTSIDGFYAGIFKDTRIVPALLFGVGLDYMQSGATADSTNDKQEMDYLSIPLYIKAKAGPVFGLGGIGVNFLVSEKGNVIAASEETSTNKVNYPVFVGAGLKLGFLTIEARYNWGLAEINSTGVNSHYLQVGAAVSF